jgi:predicted DNA-binding transcriptional regulator AlpA
MSELLDELKNLLTNMQSANDPKDSFPKEGPVTTDQVAKFFNVTTKTIREWRKERTDFPRPVTFNERTTRYDAEDIRGFWNKIANKKAS